MGCKQQSVVLSDEELKSFKEGSTNPQNPGGPPPEGSQPGNPDNPVSDAPGQPGPDSDGEPNMPPSSAQSSPANPGRPGGGGLGVNPDVEANATRPNRPNGNPRPNGGGSGRPQMPRREADRVESGDFTVAGAKVAVTGAFKLNDGKIVAWKADGSANPSLKTEVEAQLDKLPEGMLDRIGQGPSGNVVFVVSQVTGSKRPNMVQSEFGGMGGGLGRLFGGDAANKIFSFANVQEGASTVSIRYRIEEQAPMTGTLAFKEGSSAKLGTGTITLQSLSDQPAPEPQGEGDERRRGGMGDAKPTGHLVFLKAGLPRAPFSLQLVGKDGKAFTLVDKDGKPTAMPQMTPGQRPSGQGMERMRDIRPAYFLVSNDEGSVVVNLLVKRELISSIKVTITPQTIIERKGIAAKPK
ncbi:MAG: hypothetical protein JNK63_04535 [Chthonomonas sp.]|nr:hypothetical protein [Chthonomonas sp.]